MCVFHAVAAWQLLVDYAHTPDAVSRVLKSARSFTSGRVIGILGCGGDRDKSKRSPMGQALFAGSDLAIFTSDNPRNEKADEILNENIKEGETISIGLDKTKQEITVKGTKTPKAK